MVKQIKLFSNTGEKYIIPSWKKDFAIAKSFFKDGDYKEAILFFTYSLKSKPNNTESLFFRGLSNIHLKKKNNLLLAIQDFTRSILIKPTYQVYVNRSAAYIFLKEYEKSIKDCNKAIEANRKNSKAYFNRAISNLYLSRFDEAKNDIKKDIKLNKNSEYDSYLLKGLIEQKAGEYKEAIKSFKKVLNFTGLKGGDMLLSIQKCSLNNLFIGDIRSAIEYAKDGLEKSEIYRGLNYLGESEPWMTYLSYCFIKLENFNQAYYWCNKIILKCSKKYELEFLIIRGYIESKFGKYERSLEDLGKAFKINESDFKNRYLKIYGLNIENLIYDLPKEMKNILIISENISLN